MKRSFFTFITLVWLAGCQDKTDIIRISAYDKEVIAYFPQVALGFENENINRVTRKWKEEMKIYLYGSVSENNRTEAANIISELNSLSTDDFSISITQDSVGANLYLFMGSEQAYGEAIPFFRNHVEGFNSYFYLYWNSNNELYLSFCFVNNETLNQDEQYYQLRQVITRSLGFGRYPYQYAESMFNGDYWAGQGGYADIDKDVIRLMYHPSMQTGMVEGDSLNNLLLTILLNEK